MTIAAAIKGDRITLLSGAFATPYWVRELRRPSWQCVRTLGAQGMKLKGISSGCKSLPLPTIPRAAQSLDMHWDGSLSSLVFSPIYMGVILLIILYMTSKMADLRCSWKAGSLSRARDDQATASHALVRRFLFFNILPPSVTSGPAICACLVADTPD